ncbi:hypothetical protein [Halothiobacillus diazotrophicus]|nr:hypothetical protein [Halothiobacillus diazotrophicus]
MDGTEFDDLWPLILEIIGEVYGKFFMPDGDTINFVRDLLEKGYSKMEIIAALRRRLEAINPPDESPTVNIFPQDV